MPLWLGRLEFRKYMAYRRFGRTVGNPDCLARIRVFTVGNGNDRRNG